MSALVSRRADFFNTLQRPYSDTCSEGVLEGLVGPVSPLTILGTS